MGQVAAMTGLGAIPSVGGTPSDTRDRSRPGRGGMADFRAHGDRAVRVIDGGA